MAEKKTVSRRAMEQKIQKKAPLRAVSVSKPVKDKAKDIAASKDKKKG
jgi:hypothetical protein